MKQEMAAAKEASSRQEVRERVVRERVPATTRSLRPHTPVA
jgi:hypothetical protein